MAITHRARAALAVTTFAVTTFAVTTFAVTTFAVTTFAAGLAPPAGARPSAPEFPERRKAHPGLTVALVGLPRAATSGTVLDAVLRFDNRSGAPIDLTEVAGCTPKVAVALVGRRASLDAAMTLECGSAPFLVPEGRSRRAVQVGTARVACIGMVSDPGGTVTTDGRATDPPVATAAPPALLTAARAGPDPTTDPGAPAPDASAYGAPAPGAPCRIRPLPPGAYRLVEVGLPVPVKGTVVTLR